MTPSIPNIRSQREELGLSRAELAKLARISVQTVERAEKNKPIRPASMDAILRVLEGRSQTAAPPVPVPPADPLMEAMANLINALRSEFRRELDERVEEAVTSRLLSLAVPQQAAPYIPPPSDTPADVAPAPTVTGHGLPDIYKPSGWKIVYLRRFIKDLDNSGGLKGLGTNAIRKFATHGEQHSGTGFKKLQVLESRQAQQVAGAQYEFRINRRWRILVRKDNEARTYTLTRVVHHDEVE